MGHVRQEDKPSPHEPGHRRPCPQRRPGSRHDESRHDSMTGTPMEGTRVTGEESWDKIGICQVGTDDRMPRPPRPGAFQGE